MLFMALVLGMISCGGSASTDGTSSSSSNGKALTVSGNISDAANLSIFLDEMTLGNKSFVLGKADIDANGNFSIKIEEPAKMAPYRIRIGAQRMFFVCDKGDNDVKISGSLAGMPTYGLKVSGSSAATSYNDLLNNYYSKKKQLPQLISAIS